MLHVFCMARRVPGNLQWWYFVKLQHAGLNPRGRGFVFNQWLYNIVPRLQINKIALSATIRACEKAKHWNTISEVCRCFYIQHLPAFCICCLEAFWSSFLVQESKTSPSFSKASWYIAGPHKESPCYGAQWMLAWRPTMLAARQLFEDNFMQLCTGQFLLAIRLGYVNRIHIGLHGRGNLSRFKSEKRLLMCRYQSHFRAAIKSQVELSQLKPLWLRTAM